MERSKFNVDKNTLKRTYNDIVFDSEIEMKFYRDWLLPKVGSGEIVDYELQRKYILQPQFKHGGKTVKEIAYKADFWVKYRDGKEIVYDTKGMPDAVAKLKRKMFWYYFPDLPYLWICYSKCDGGWIEYEELLKARKKRKRERQQKKLLDKEHSSK